uniref:Uncharacterized protein n=1 Tax=Cairina moschata TaxID=8855 RepID=A0A8C3C7G7_CAIMO
VCFSEDLFCLLSFVMTAIVCCICFGCCYLQRKKIQFFFVLSLYEYQKRTKLKGYRTNQENCAAALICCL